MTQKRNLLDLKMLKFDEMETLIYRPGVSFSLHSLQRNNSIITTTIIHSSITALTFNIINQINLLAQGNFFKTAPLKLSIEASTSRQMSRISSHCQLLSEKWLQKLLCSVCTNASPRIKTRLIFYGHQTHEQRGKLRHSCSNCLPEKR